MQIEISSIKVPERIRSDLGDLQPLMDSLTRCGQLNPITVTRDMVLIAGHRRLEAATKLGWRSIDATVIDGIDEIRRTEIELEENIHRKDFSPEELLEGMRKLEKLRRPKPLRRMARAIGKAFSVLAFWRYFGRRKKKREEAEEQRVEFDEPIDQEEEDVADFDEDEDTLADEIDEVEDTGKAQGKKQSKESSTKNSKKNRSKSRRKRKKNRQTYHNGEDYGV